MSVLFCDTDCELWYTQAEELGIRVIGMPYVLEGKAVDYDLGKATDFKYFYQKLREGELPTTAALNEYDYINYFEPVLAAGDDIFYITFSHKLSGTFEHMDRAIATLKEKYPDRKITTFDTKSISMGAGITVWYAGLLRKNGATDEELLAFLEGFAPRVRTYFCVDSLDHLKRGGRISAATKFFGTILGIKPMLAIMPDGTIQNISKTKGPKVISDLAGYVRDQGGDFDKYDVWVLHGDDEEGGKKLVERVKEYVPSATVHLQIVGPVIAAHAGPGTLAVVFVGKQ